MAIAIYPPLKKAILNQDDAVDALVYTIAALKYRGDPMSKAVENLKRFIEHIDSYSPGIRPDDDAPVRDYAPHSWLTVGDLRQVLREVQDKPKTGGAVLKANVNASPSLHQLISKPCCPGCGLLSPVSPTGNPGLPWQCLACGIDFA